MSDKKTPWNPSKSAVKRVKDPAPVIWECHYCQNPVTITQNKGIYGRNYGDWPWVYMCIKCAAYVGMHPFTNIPLGTLADAKTREARKRAKTVFLLLYKKEGLARTKAYEVLALRMGIPASECHFGMFTPSQCGIAYQCSKQILVDLKMGVVF